MLSQPATSLRFKRLLLTGADGNLGRELRPRLRAYCDVLRLSHRREFGAAVPGEEIVISSLEDKDAMVALLEGVDAVVHMGGASTERPFEPILASNIVGVYNLYEAARKQRVKRIVFASSNHITGFYPRDQVINPLAPVRPDGYYGISKAFGENMGRFYWDRYGIETVALRIGSSYAEPKDWRMLDSWLSFDDLERLVVAALAAPVVGFTAIYGMSDNPQVWWDNTPAKHIGFRPRDSSEVHRAMIQQKFPFPDANDPANSYQGGGFVTAGPFD
jgi:uronate dehydrogenase